MTVEQREKLRELTAQQLTLAAAESDLFRELLDSETFQSFWAELEKSAERRCIDVVAARESNYAKAEAAGIINFVRRTKSEMVRKASPKYREALKKRLEVLNEQENRSHRRGGRKLRGFTRAIGQF